MLSYLHENIQYNMQFCEFLLLWAENEKWLWERNCLTVAAPFFSLWTWSVGSKCLGFLADIKINRCLIPFHKLFNIWLKVDSAHLYGNFRSEPVDGRYCCLPYLCEPTFPIQINISLKFPYSLWNDDKKSCTLLE